MISVCRPFMVAGGSGLTGWYTLTGDTLVGKDFALALYIWGIADGPHTLKISSSPQCTLAKKSCKDQENTAHGVAALSASGIEEGNPFRD